MGLIVSFAATAMTALVSMSKAIGLLQGFDAAID
jgi:hypothetical protein